MSWLPWLALGGLLTFLTRLSFIALLGRIRTPPRLARALRFVPASILSAVIVPEVVLRDGALALSPSNPRLVAGLAAVAVAAVTRSVLATIGVGMVVLWAMQAWAPW
jgi:branched-subunit amino acid transport protein